MLTEAMVNGFLASLSGSPWTLKGYRCDLLTLWRAAADEDLAAYPVMRRIRRERLPALLVECYREDEARSLVRSAGELAGCLANGVPRRLYWAAVIRAAWDSGLRRGDLWRLRRDSIAADGSFRIVQHKTGGIACCRLRQSTLDAIGGNLPLAWPHNGWTFGEWFWKLLTASGVNRGSFKWLRRASGSYVESQSPGCGHKHLGHGSPRTFAEHYDAHLKAASFPLPPEL